MDKLHVLQKNVFELEIRLLGDERLLAYPNVATGPLEMNFDLLPFTKFLSRSDNSDRLTILRRVLHLKLDCVSLIHETRRMMIFHIEG